MKYLIGIVAMSLVGIVCSTGSVKAAQVEPAQSVYCCQFGTCWTPVYPHTTMCCLVYCN